MPTYLDGLDYKDRVRREERERGQTCTDNALEDYRPADYRHQIIGRLPIVYFRTNLRSIKVMLAPVARKLWCPPATRVPSDRLLSGAGLIYSDRRSRLAAEKAEKLLFTRTNMAAFNF